MKNPILSMAIACVAIIFGVNNTYAQKSKTQIGIKAGLSLTTLGAATNNGVSVNYGYRPGFQGGVFLEAPLSSSILFSPQVLYTQKGGNINTTISGIKFDGYIQLNYIDVPLLVGFKASPNLSFYIGPQVAFLLSEKDVITASNGSGSTSTSTTGTTKTLFGGNLGAGYKLNKNVGLNINYIYDFSHAAEEGYSNGERNSGFVFSLGYSF
ncbi:hypothetical protein GCM10027049_25440 [Mucilaginibacter puniceus]